MLQWKPLWIASLRNSAENVFLTDASAVSMWICECDASKTCWMLNGFLRKTKMKNTSHGIDCEWSYSLVFTCHFRREASGQFRMLECIWRDNFFVRCIFGISTLRVSYQWNESVGAKHDNNKTHRFTRPIHWSAWLHHRVFTSEMQKAHWDEKCIVRGTLRESITKQHEHDETTWHCIVHLSGVNKFRISYSWVVVVVVVRRQYIYSHLKCITKIPSLFSGFTLNGDSFSSAVFFSSGIRIYGMRATRKCRKWMFGNYIVGDNGRNSCQRSE